MDITDTLIRAMVGRVEITSPGTDVKLVVTVFAVCVLSFVLFLESEKRLAVLSSFSGL